MFIAAVKKGVIPAAHVYALFRGDSGLSDIKKALTTFLVLNIFLQKSKVPEEVQHFPGGGGCSNFFQRGGGGRVRLIILYRNPYNL